MKKNTLSDLYMVREYFYHYVATDLPGNNVIQCASFLEKMVFSKMSVT